MSRTIEVEREELGAALDEAKEILGSLKTIQLRQWAVDRALQLHACTGVDADKIVESAEKLTVYLQSDLGLEQSGTDAN